MKNSTCPPRLVSLFIASALFLASGSATAEEVKEILVVENTKTTDATVRFITGIEEGDDWNEEVQEEVRERLVSSGLFKDVELFSEPHPKGGGVRVTVIAKDKHSWVIAPTFYNQPTNTGGGLGFGENNLFGENKKLLLYGQVATGDTFFVGAYIDPSIGGTRFSWAYDMFLRYERVIEYNAPTKFIDTVEPVRQSKMMYLNSGLKLGMTLFRKLKLEQRIRGAKVAFYKNQIRDGKTIDDICQDPTLCPRAPEPGKEGWDISTESVLTFDNRANWYGVTSGSKFRVAYEQALPSLNSDYDYDYLTVSYERARKYYTSNNFIIKTMVGYGNNLPFQAEYTAGGTSLRGYESKMFRGDTKVAANLEYSVPLFTIKGLGFRGLAFWDSSYVAFRDLDPETQVLGDRNYLPGHGELGLTPFKNSVGAGIRLYVRQIVLPLLGFDIGYGLESGSVETWFAIGLTDF